MAKDPPPPHVRRAFAERLYQECGYEVKAMSLPVSGVIGMACLESAYGTSDHFLDYNILFGITAPYKDGWDLPGCKVRDVEWVYLDTQAIKDGPIIKDRFCIAPTLAAAFGIFRAFIENHPMLKSKSGQAALKAAAKDPAAFARVMATRCLFGAGNATEYPKTVMRIIEQEHLRRFDEGIIA
jgi:hypothetical protein